MKTARLLLFALLFSSGLAYAGQPKDLSISFDAKDDRVQFGARHRLQEARVAITSRDGAVTLLLLHDVVAVQLTDQSLAQVSTKEGGNFVEELLAAGVRLAVGKAVEFPIANLRTVELRDGALVMISDHNEPVFANMKVNGAEVLHDFAPEEATRFVNAFRARKH